MSGQPAITFNCQSCNKSYRVPAEMAGRQAKCKSCGKMMSVPGSQAPEQDSFASLIDKPFSFGQDKEEKQELKFEKQVAPPKLVKSESGKMLVAYDPSTAPSAKKRKAQKKTGFFESFSGMWEALVSPHGAMDEAPPVTRRISLGGLYLIVGSIFTFIYMGISKTDISGLRLEVDESASEQILGYLPALLNPVVLATLLAVAGIIVMARRVWMPRPEKEVPIVMIVFGGVTAMLTFVWLYLMFGNYNKAVEMATFGGYGVLLAAAAFGLWVLVRLGEESDGRAMYLVLIPAFLLPTLFVLKIMTLIPEGGWGDVPWGQIIKFWFITVFVLTLMGGAMSFFIVTALVLHMLDIGEPPPITAGLRLDMWTLGALSCLGCYLWLAVTRWRVMMKPVAWQVSILLVAGTLMGFYRNHAQNEYLADLSREYEDSNVVYTNAYSRDGSFQIIRQDDIPDSSPHSSRNNPRRDLVTPGRDRPRTPTPRTPDPPRLPEPIFTVEELPRGAEEQPAKEAGWPEFDLPNVDMGQSQTVSVWGYSMQLLPGYRVTRMLDPISGERKLIIAGPEIEDPSLAIELDLLPQIRNEDGEVAVIDWPGMIQLHDIDTDDGYVDYGTIDSIPFLRFAPELNRFDRYRQGITYISRLPDSLSRVVVNIPTSGRSLDHLLACEAMVRSLERIEPQLGPAMPDSAENLTLTVAQYSPDVIQSTEWDLVGIFAYPESVSYYARVDSNRQSGLKVDFSIRESNASMSITMQPAKPGQSREVRIQAQGPEVVGGGDDAFDGRMIYAFGSRVSFDRLWADSVFVRVQRGVTEIDRGQAYETVTYHGWVGSYWTTIDLRRRPNQSLPMSELDSLMRLLRLANPLEQTQDRGYQDWMPRMLRSEPADLPLAGGLTIAEAFELNEVGQAVLSPNLNPETGGFVEIYPELSPAQLEGYALWRTNATMLEHLGEPMRMGPLEIRPIAELERSRNSNERLTEWFANTNAGRLGMSLRVDTFRDDEVVPSVPVSIDPDTGEYVILVGRRVLRQPADNPPTISYRESRGLRVWRFLMPQVPGADTRRCYYVAAMPGQVMSMSATFVRDSAGQLMAMDAMVGSLIHRPVQELE